MHTGSAPQRTVFFLHTDQGSNKYDVVQMCKSIWYENSKSCDV